jgi:hypothetical protein
MPDLYEYSLVKIEVMSGKLYLPDRHILSGVPIDCHACTPYLYVFPQPQVTMLLTHSLCNEDTDRRLHESIAGTSHFVWVGRIFQEV